MWSTVYLSSFLYDMFSLQYGFMTILRMHILIPDRQSPTFEVGNDQIGSVDKLSLLSQDANSSWGSFVS